MSRGSTPERLHAARRSPRGDTTAPESARELPDEAERLVAQWELQAAKDGLERDGRYWDAGWAWMLARRR